MTHRARVAAAFVLTTFPLLAIAAAFLWQSVRATEARFVDERIVLARSIAMGVGSFLDSEGHTVATLAHARSMKDPSSVSDLEAWLKEILAANPDWENIAVNDPDGWNIVATAAPPRSVNLGDRDYIRRAISTGETSISPILRDRATGSVVVAVAAPVDFAAGGRGTVRVALSPQDFAAKLSTILARSDAEVVVVDSEGTALIHPDSAVAQELSSFRSRADAGAALAGQTGAIQVIGRDGSERLSAYAPVPGFGWAVLVTTPRAVLTGRLQEKFAGALGLFGLALVTTGVVGWHLGGRLAASHRAEEEALAQAEAIADELRQVAMENEARRRFLEQLIESAPMLIAVIGGTEQRMVMANARVKAVRPDKEFIGKTLAELFPEVVQSGALGIVAQVYRTGQRFSGVDRPALLATESGEVEERFFTYVIARYEDSQGDPQGVLFVGLETTEAVAERRRAEREKDEFLATASHELKTPLTALVLAANLVERMVAAGSISPERLGRHAGTIKQQAARASQLIGDLLDVSRLQSGQLPMRREPVDLVALVTAAAQRQRDGLSEDGSPEIEEHYQEAALFVEGDEARLDQVLTNLLSNAVNYSSPGSPIEVSLVGADADAVVTVADHGIGIPASEREDIFTPFRRSDATRNRGIEGTGLGLSIARRIVQAHGGKIAVEETPGGGATFLVRLPLNRQRSPLPETEAMV